MGWAQRFNSTPCLCLLCPLTDERWALPQGESLVRRSTLQGLKWSLCCCFLVSESYPTLWPPWTVAHWPPLSVGFPRQEYWSGLQFPPKGDLPVPGIEPESPSPAGWFFTTEQPGKPKCKVGLIVPWKSQKLNQGCWDKNKKTLDDMDVYGKQHLAFSSVLS